MIVSETARLRIRAWKKSDRDLFAEINSDPKVMEFFPFRRNRAESDALFDRVGQGIAETGFGFFALALKADDRPIGFCGLALANLEPHLPKGAIEIGWRLAVPFWGKGYVTEAASDLLRYGFEEKGLGMRHDASRDFDHPRVPADKPALVRHVLYATSATEWRERRLKAGS